MEKKRLSRESKAFIVALIFISFVMFLCNLLTDLCVDDFCYMGSFATKERIDSLWDIFPSMAVHAKTMNGRVVAHFFVQLFLLLPLPIFKIINTAVFVLQILLILHLAGAKRNQRWFLALCAFALIWVYEPAFGQVNLWLDGACNYLWSSVLALMYLCPFAELFISGREIKRIPLRIAFCGVGLFAGAFAESTAVSVIFMSVCIIVLCFICGKKVSVWYFAALASALIGFIFMISAPAEFENKLAEMNFGTLRVNFIAALDMLKSFAVLPVSFAVLACAHFYLVKNKRTLLLSFILALGALCANFIHIFAGYYPGRCASFCVVLFVAADSLLAGDLLETDARLPIKCAAAALVVIFAYHLAFGVNDVFSTHIKISENEQRIEECREAGIMNVELPMFVTHSKYSAVSGLKYLDTETSDTWPNNHMAAYYGVESIIGYWE